MGIQSTEALNPSPGASACRFIQSFPENRPGADHIGDLAFARCDKLSRLGPLSSGCEFGQNPFGYTLPKALYACVENLYPRFADYLLIRYVLNEAAWPELAPDLQAGIFMTRQGRTLVPAYEKCVTDPDALGRNILARLSGKPSEKECNAVAAFLNIFSQKASAEIRKQLHDVL